MRSVLFCFAHCKYRWVSSTYPADLDVSAEIVTDLVIETYIECVLDRISQMPEYSSSAVHRIVTTLPYHVMVNLPQLAHIREAISDSLATQPTQIEFSLVSNLMCAALAYCVPIRSLEEEEGTCRMPQWTKKLEKKEIFVVHIGLGFSSCGGYEITTEDDDNDSPTLVALSQKSVAFGTKDFIDCIVDSPKFSSAIATQLAQFSSQHQGIKFNHNKDFVYKSFETFMGVWSERIEHQIKGCRFDEERNAVMVRDDDVDINFSMYSDHKASFKLSVREVYRMCQPVWQTLQNLIIQVRPSHKFFISALESVATRPDYTTTTFLCADLQRECIQSCPYCHFCGR